VWRAKILLHYSIGNNKDVVLGVVRSMLGILEGKNNGIINPFLSKGFTFLSNIYEIT